MARPLMSPKSMQERRDLALRLLADGESSIRAVAEAVGAHPASVHAWKRAAGDGVAALVVFDRHGTEGAGWYEDDALAKQAERAARRQSATGSTAARRRARGQSEGREDTAPRRRRRARRMGETLREHLGLPELQVQPRSAQHVANLPTLHGWDTPALCVRITTILQHHPVSVARGGLTASQLRGILGTSFLDENDATPDDRIDFAEKFCVALQRYGFARASDDRWSAPR